MNGIIVINKEKGMTSHDVVNQVRKIFKTKKVGHLGTLDPNATGVLAICINDATKLVQFLLEHNKTYIARVCLGKKTDTYDLDEILVLQAIISLSPLISTVVILGSLQFFSYNHWQDTTIFIVANISICIEAYQGFKGFGLFRC